MNVALQRSISGDRNAHKHARSAVFVRTTAVIPGCYVLRFVTEILIAGEYDFLWPKSLCATSGVCIA